MKAGGRVIALISQKGGAGKTTVAMQLAAGFALRGRSTAVCDLDPQESALRWSQSAPARDPFPAPVFAVSEAEAADRIAALRRSTAIVLLDCPPSIEQPGVLAALELADAVLVPVVPSPPDLWSARAVERLVVQHMRRRKGLRAALLANRVQRTALSASVIEVLREFELPVLRAGLSQRNAFAQSAAIGGSVFSLGKAAATAQVEVMRVVEAVAAMMERRR